MRAIRKLWAAYEPSLTEGCGERGALHTITLSSAEWHTRPGSCSLGQVGLVRVKLPHLQARLNNADAVLRGDQRCRCPAVHGGGDQWRRWEI